MASSKMKSNGSPAKRGKQSSDWVERYGLRLPRNARPVHVRLGDVVEHLDGPPLAIVVSMTAESATVRFEDGQERTYPWGELRLAHIAPDPVLLPNDHPVYREVLPGITAEFDQAGNCRAFHEPRTALVGKAGAR